MIEKLVEGERIIPERTLNLELKYLDENVRPFLLQMDQAYANYILGGPAAPIIAFGTVGINAAIRVNRFTKKEVDDLRRGFMDARAKLNSSGSSGDGFGGAIQLAMDALSWKIADVYMFARPPEEQRESFFSVLLKDALEKEKLQKKETKQGE